MYINVRMISGRTLQETSTDFDCKSCIKFKDCEAVQYKTNCILYDALRARFNKCYMVPYFTTNQPRLIDILQTGDTSLPIMMAAIDRAKAKCMGWEK